jgi:dTDP-4-amino-4,6-dideoxygalactose transaminase
MNQPIVPDLEQFSALSKEAFSTRCLTNNGKFYQEFEDKLKDFLECDYIIPVTNATVGLFTALKVLNIKGEVITVLFTFPATFNLLFNFVEITPVFVDISPETFCISPESIRKSITEKTVAILPVNAYGFPCDVEAIDEIAGQSNLKVIYDATPSFAVKYRNRSIVNFGDISVLSFHATKVFNTGEGGAIVCKSEELYQKCKHFIDHGIIDRDCIELSGFNGKLDEIRSIMGILNLQKVSYAIECRKNVVEKYLALFSKVKSEKIVIPHSLYASPDTVLNYTYFPIVASSEDIRDLICEELRKNGIHARKYYYPNPSDMPNIKIPAGRVETMSNTSFISKRVLCLPVNPYFTDSDCAYIQETLLKVFKANGIA